MGRALLDGWIKADAVSDVIIVDPKSDPVFKTKTHYTDVASVPDKQLFDVVLLAIKPQLFDEVLPTLTRFVRAETVFLSIAAGKTIQNMRDKLAEAAIIRAMPNTPAMIGHGISVCVAGSGVTPTQRDLAEILLHAAGDVVWINDENWMHAVTAVSGSGPAYIFALIEAMQHAGERLGLPTELAAQLARKTVEGSAALAAFSPDKAPAELRQNVTSPGGTTEVALKILQSDNGLNQLFEAALQAAAQRSSELSS